MNDALLHVYHRFPPQLRSLTASVRGIYLRTWRYGRQSDRLVEEALEREGWSAERWTAWQQERLAYVLHRAATRVPYYRALWERRRREGDRRSWEVLGNWPVLTKNAVREQPRAFVADDCRVGTMFEEHTSGTTGKPLTVWWSRATVREWYALVEARIRQWHGVSRHDRWAILGGQLVAAFDQKEPPFWTWNAGLHQLYLSAYHLRPGHAAAYLEALRKYRVTYLLGYPSAMSALAQFALEQNLDAPPLRIAISNAEPLYRQQRESIGRAFRCDVVDTYGMCEIVCAASECHEHRQHLWPEVGVLEVLEDESHAPVSTGQSGRLVCSGILNADMPLIRYEVGDRGALGGSDETCACGRSLPMLSHVEGRMDDVVITRDGRRIGRLDPVFKSDLHIHEAQIVQEDVQRLHVRVIAAPGYTAHEQLAIVRRLQERVGDMEITLELVNQIPRSANGKFRAVLSTLTPARP